MIDFLFIYEHKARELENICLLKVELDKRGYSTEIINVHNLKKIKYFLWKPKVIVLPYLYDDVDLQNLVYSKFGRVDKVVNLQWEQVFSKKWENIGFHIPREHARYVTHICWGKESFKRLKKAGNKNAIITGPLHMDFLKENFRGYYKTKEQLIREYKFDRDKKIILYISSFTYTTLKPDELRGLENRVSAKVGDIKASMIESRIETLKWIETLLLEKDDIIFIYRPHPNEKNDCLIEKLQNKYKNFKVIDKYSVKQWIVVSDTIFTWFSTSIVEAYFAKKNCFILRPKYLEEDLDCVINIGANYIASYNEMIKVIESNCNEFPISSDIISNHYFVNNDSSYVKICNVLEKVLKTNKYNIPKSAFQGSNVNYLIDIIIDEIIDRFNLLYKENKVYSKKIYNRIIECKKERERFDKDLSSKKEINKILRNIKKIIK